MMPPTDGLLRRTAFFASLLRHSSLLRWPDSRLSGLHSHAPSPKQLWRVGDFREVGRLRRLEARRASPQPRCKTGAPGLIIHRANSASLLFLLILFLALIVEPSVSAQTRAIGGSAVGVDFCWALDGENYPYLTSDSGASWVKKPKISNKKIVAIDESGMWALAEDGSTFLSNDGAETWQTRPSIPDNDLVGISGGNPVLAWALTEGGNAYSYYAWNDPTAVWEYKGKAAEERFVSISANNLFHAWALADNGNLYEYTTDVGEWYLLTDIGPGDFVSVDGNHYGPSIPFISGFALTRDGKVYRTIDEGNTWEYRGKVGDEVYTAIGTITRYWAWVIAENGNTYLTPGDGGVTWERKENIGLYNISVLGSSDYDGDGRSDVAVFRSSRGLWAIKDYTRVYFGAPPVGVRPPAPSTSASGSDPCTGDLAANGDYDGDGTADVAIYRPETGLWAAKGISRIYFGGGANVSTPADYDGDGRCDVAVFNRGSGLWSVRGVTRVYYGSVNDLPVPGDYDGDGSAEIAVFRPSNGLWSIRGLTRCYFGRSGDRPIPGVYGEGEAAGATKIAVFRPTLNALWAVKDFTRFYFGLGDDFPVPADYDSDGLDEFAVFRSSTGLWALRGLTRCYFGTLDDLPVTR